MSDRVKWLVAVAGAAALVTACGGGGGGDVGDIVLDSLPPTTTTIAPAEPAPGGTGGPVTTATGGAPDPAAAAGEWVAVTGNLTGMASECGNVMMASDPAHDLFVVGVALHGLWSVAPGTDQWTQLGTGGGDAITNRLATVLVDPDDPNTYWESGSYGSAGVYRTSDSGASFQQQGDVVQTDYLSIDFTDPERQTMLLGSHEQPVLYRSTDGGESWDEVPGLPDGLGYASSPYVVDAQTLLLGTSNSDGAGVFRSTDGGTTWTSVFEGGVVGAPVVQGGTIHWLEQNGAGLITSADEGATWTEQGGAGAIAQTAAQLVAMPDGSLVTFGSQNVVQSTDGGATWQNVGPALPYTPNNVAYAAGEGSFYVSRFDCSFSDENPIKPDAILRLVTA